MFPSCWSNLGSFVVFVTSGRSQLCMLCGCAGACAVPADRARPCRTGTAGPCATPKFCGSFALYRQSEIYARQGVEMSARRWPTGLAGQHCSLRWLKPSKHVLKPRSCTPTTRRSGARAGQRQDQDRTSLDLCTRRRPAGEAPPRLVRLFARSQRRTSAAHLKNFRGILQADAYAGYVANAIMLRSQRSCRLDCGFAFEYNT